MNLTDKNEKITFFEESSYFSVISTPTNTTQIHSLTSETSNNFYNKNDQSQLNKKDYFIYNNDVYKTKSEVKPNLQNNNENSNLEFENTTKNSTIYP